MQIKERFTLFLTITFLLPLTGLCTENAHESGRLELKRYDEIAKSRYSENDVKAFVYQWFAGFDHQADFDFFEKHLNPGKINMSFPDQPIKSLEDFHRWYANVIDTIQWNTHKISDIEVSGDEMTGFSVGCNVHWIAKSYSGETYDMNIHQDWKVAVDKSRNFIIEKHEAKVIAQDGRS